MMQKLGAEFLGTFALVLVGCGVAILGGVGLLGTALAFGITLLALIYSIGHISGGHFNPAVTIAMAVNCRMNCKEVAPYIIAQVLGAIAGAFVLSMIASGKAGYDVANGMLGANGFGAHSMGGYGQNIAILTEVVVTALFVTVILGSTSGKSISSGHAPLAVGLALTAFILLAGNVTGASLNPARSMGPAVIAGGWAWDQVWLFWVAPVIGAVVGGYLYRWSMCCGTCSTGSCGTSK